MGMFTHIDLGPLFMIGLLGSHVSMVHFNWRVSILKSAGKEDEMVGYSIKRKMQHPEEKRD
jgi:hypothetical protein